MTFLELKTIQGNIAKVTYFKKEFFVKVTNPKTQYNLMEIFKCHAEPHFGVDPIDQKKAQEIVKKLLIELGDTSVVEE